MSYQLIKNLEREYGNLHEIIPKLASEYGQAEAGRRLGVSATTINIWLRKNGYKPVRIFVRKEQSE